MPVGDSAEQDVVDVGLGVYLARADVVVLAGRVIARPAGIDSLLRYLRARGDGLCRRRRTPAMRR